MAKALEAAVTSESIVFELERFERSDGRLNLSGRWFGVRGRRFVRPTLTLEVDGGRTRALADLDHKPWAAEDGEPWMASFPWESGDQLGAPELSVAPDITIQLPAPSSRRSRSQRLAALSRRDAIAATYGEWTTEPTEPAEVAVARPEPPTPAPEPPPAPTPTEEERLLGQLADANNAAAAGRAELEAVRSELEAVRGELETTRSELAEARAAREAALRSAARAEAEREAALTSVAEAEAERDRLAAEQARLAAALEQAQGELEHLSREHDQAMNARGAALVMRGATQALPAYEGHVGWWRRGIAVLVPIGAVLAALIVLHAF